MRSKKSTRVKNDIIDDLPIALYQPLKTPLTPSPPTPYCVDDGAKSTSSGAEKLSLSRNHCWNELHTTRTVRPTEDIVE